MVTRRAPNFGSWQELGRTARASYYLVEPCAIACIPDDHSTDDATTALENTAFQEGYWTRTGRKGVCIVFFDYLADQTSDARNVYRTFAFRNQVGTALVGGTALSRAIASFFTGLSRPHTPTRFFGSEQDALQWCRELGGNQ